MRWKLNIPQLLPGLAGLFFVRLLVELWAVNWHTAVSPLITIPLASICAIFAIWLCKNQPIQHTWPLSFLIVYLLLPHISFLLALFTLTFTALTIIFTQYKKPLRLRASALNLSLTVAFLILYTLTLAPDILTADNGEFQWVPTLGGVLHPPGFPLYTMLANIASRIPIGDTPAIRISFLSAISSSLVLFFVYLTIIELTKNKPVEVHKDDDRHAALAKNPHATRNTQHASHNVQKTPSNNWGAITAVITLGTATTFWAQATTANVRSLTALFATIVFYLLIKLQTTKGKQFDKVLLTAVCFTSLGVAHHPSLAFFAIIFVIYVLWLTKTSLFSLQKLSTLALAILPGLLTFLYLPLRAGSNAPGARASLATWSGFLNHALARGFSGDFFFFIEPTILLERFRIMGNVFRFQFSPWLLFGMLIGAILLLKTNKPVGFLLIGSFLLHTFVTATYRAPQTVEYMMPAYVPMVICVGIAVGQGQRLPWQTATRYIKPVLTASLFLLAVGQGIANWPSFWTLHQETDTRDYSLALLRSAEPNSIILADWHWYTPLRYLHEVEEIRPDVEIRFVAPEGDDYGVAWANRIAAELQNGRSVIATHFDPNAYQDLPAYQPVGEAFHFSQIAINELPDAFQPLALPLGNVEILGMEMGEETAVIGTEFTVTLAWQSTNHQPANVYIHVIGFDGHLYAQDDKTVPPAANGLTRTQFRLTLRPGSQPGAFAIFAGQGDAREQLGMLNAVAAEFPPVTQTPLNFPVQNEQKTLIGVDWDQTLPNRTRLYAHWQTPAGYFTTVLDDDAIAQATWPTLIGAWGRSLNDWQPTPPKTRTHYVPFGRQMVWLGGSLVNEPVAANEEMITRLAFASAAPILRDTAVSVRLIGFEADQFTWNWESLDDSIPAMGAIPTLKWIAGSRVTSPHFLTVSETATSGQTVGTTLRLYDAFTNQPLPILDERITADFQWVPMSETRIR